MRKALSLFYFVHGNYNISLKEAFSLLFLENSLE